jgi:hypothetical protein
MVHTLAPAPIRRVVLVTDFGEGIYVGQMHARLDALLPGMRLVDLVQDLAPFRPDLAAYLLPALMRDMPQDSLYLCVVDPGVGGERAGLVVQADGTWLIGPDNGLFAQVLRGAADRSVWRIGWGPPLLSASFHGRDWFVPVAARLCRGEDLALSALDPAEIVGADWPAELGRILYLDRFGNLMTGLKPLGPTPGCLLQVGDQWIPAARTFCEVAPGQPFWYENALGLVELAVNQGRADQHFGLAVGDPIGPLQGPAC